MVRQLKTFLLLLLLLAYSAQVIGQPNVNDNLGRVIAIREVQEKFGCDSIVADNFVYYLEKNLQTIQYLLGQIASTETTMEVKQKCIERLLNYHFLADATVQVSSSTRMYTTDMPIREYLDKLSKLDKIYKYRKVELVFDPHYGKLAISRSPGFDDIFIATKQLFLGCKGELQGCYTDMTFKQLRFQYKEVGGNQELKVKSIKISETIQMDPITSRNTIINWGKLTIDKSDNKTDSKTDDK